MLQGNPLIFGTALFLLGYSCTQSPHDYLEHVMANEEYHGSTTATSNPPEVHLTRDDAYPNIPSNYDASVAPDFSINNGSAPILLIFWLRNIQTIDEQEEELTMELSLTFVWTDTRLRYGSEESEDFYRIPSQNISKIWYPTIHLTDHVKARQFEIIQARSDSDDTCAVTATGSVHCGVTMKYNFACPMEFHYFPGDTQPCVLKIFSDTEMVKDSYDVYYSPSSKELRDYNLEIKLTETLHGDDEDNFKTGLYFTLFLQRKMGFHILQTYLPSCLLVVLSCLSLLIPLDESDPLAFCTAILLTLTALFSSARDNIPAVSYVKALDVWIVTCLVFVFFILLENIILLNMRQYHAKVEDKMNSNLPQPTSPTFVKGVMESVCLLPTSTDTVQDQNQSPTRKKLGNPRKVFGAGAYAGVIKSSGNARSDNGAIRITVRVFLCLNPILFTIFNGVYWTVIVMQRQT